MEKNLRYFLDKVAKKAKLNNWSMCFLVSSKHDVADYYKEATDKYVNSILKQDEAWSLLEVIKKLSKASDILLHEKDFDRMGWEEHEYAYRESLKIIKQLESITPNSK